MIVRLWSSPRCSSFSSAQASRLPLARIPEKRPCLSGFAYAKQLRQLPQHSLSSRHGNAFARAPRTSKQRLVHRPALPFTLLSIALTEESPAWTLDQIAGLVFGGIMLASVLLATKVDVFIARAQRRDLGLCEECGGLNEPETCNSSKCPYNKSIS